MVGYFSNNILPFRAGELLKSFLVSENQKISKSYALGTIVMERFLDMVILLLLMILCILISPIDNITITSPISGNKLYRISEVLDCWFESGCMPFASQYYPFKKNFNFPADFIAEGIDQTRGWFYTLLVISTALKHTSSFKNVIVNGIVLNKNNKKMSKRLKNYPDPIKQLINVYGADALRLYLLNSPVVNAQNLAFKVSGVKNILKSIIIPLQNSLNIFIQQ